MRKLLLVDDDRLLLSTLGDGLRAAGYSVQTARSGEDALTRDLAQFDAILCDHTLGGMNGSTLLKTLREQRGLKQPFVFITGTRQPEELLDEAVRFDAEYLAKPVDIRALLTLLKSRAA
jgi:CheY-like chemotaxis protein